nr:MAG TPA: hypothetical protein [Caudoviricetes sp.]
MQTLFLYHKKITYHSLKTHSLKDHNRSYFFILKWL